MRLINVGSIVGIPLHHTVLMIIKHFLSMNVEVISVANTRLLDLASEDKGLVLPELTRVNKGGFAMRFYNKTAFSRIRFTNLFSTISNFKEFFRCFHVPEKKS